MFTGLIHKVGRLIKLENAAGRGVLTIGHDPCDTPLQEGESIAVQGVCLTVTHRRTDQFVCDVLDETLDRTNLSSKRPGASLNLERALRVGESFGGHFVTGHVDGIGNVISFTKTDGDRVLEIGCDEDLTRDMVPKGSIACDGVSLTITVVATASFRVKIIPFTFEHTTLCGLEAGNTVNLETDIFGKFVRRYFDARQQDSGLDMEDLRNAGFL